MFNELDRLSNQFFKDSRDFINKIKKKNCQLCKGKGWLEVDGRLGDEIQMCQDCYKFQSDKQAFDQAKKEINVSKYKYDNFKKRSGLMQFVLVYQDEDRCKTCFLDNGSLVEKVKKLGLSKKRWIYNHRAYNQKFEDVMENMVIEYAPFQQESLTAFTDGAKIFRIT